MLSSIFAMFGTAKYYIIAIIFSLAVLYVSVLKIEISSLESENNLLKNEKVSYETAIEIAKNDVKEKIVYVEKEIEVIKWKTQTKIKTIKEYVRDENKTDCDNAIAFARSYF